MADAELLSVEAFNQAEDDLYPAVAAAVGDFLQEVASGVLGAPVGALTAAGADLNGFPDDGAWRRILRARVGPVVERLWESSYGRLAALGDAGRAAAQRFADDLAARTSGFPARVFARVRSVVSRASVEQRSEDEVRSMVADVLRQEPWDGQARVMTRTETAAALNASTLAAGFHQQDTSRTRWVKTWVSREDARVRPSHVHAHGQVRPLADPFEVGEAYLQFPGDPAGPPSESINCRCVLALRPLSSDSFASEGDNPMSKRGAPGRVSMTMGKTSRISFSITFQDSLTAAGSEDGAAITVSQDGAWEGPLGMVDEWSADDRMLAAPTDGRVDTRPLPLPMLVQRKLSPGHEGGEMGLMRLDDMQQKGRYLWGRGQIDMEDPEGVRLAHKIREQYIRFTSLDIDAATERLVCIGESGEAIPECDPAMVAGAQVGRVYDAWRVMGATMLAHPAFPEAAISMAGSDDPAGQYADPLEREAGGMVAAGLVVKAADTGRVLMMQRALDDSDPASGTWEFPGGHLEDGEDPKAAAVREWQEETGTELPDSARFVTSWDSPDGVYRGHLAVVPVEADVPLNLGHEDRTVVNPDDPDGDMVEVLAWWELEGLPEMPSLRAEVREHTPWQVIAEAGQEPGQERGENLEMAEAAVPLPQADGGEVPETGCVVPDQSSETGWRVGDCDAEGAVPANAHGTGPAEEGSAVPAQDETAVRGEDPRPEGEPADDAGHGCVKPDPDNPGQFIPADCSEPDAVPADANGGPLQHDTERGAAFMSLAASAFAHPAFCPDTAWFRDPQLTEPTLINVTPEGRIVGHLALWGVPHVSYQGRQIFAPHSPTNYERFHMRPIRTTEGLVEVGVLAMGTDHAKPYASAPGAVAHYDSTGSIVGAVRCGEDAHGIWMAGAALPDISDDQRLRLSLATFSGDWRDEGAGLDLKAALSVPAGHEGFYTPKNTPANREEYALVASGAVTAEHIAEARSDQEARVNQLVQAVLAKLEEKNAEARRLELAADSVAKLKLREDARRAGAALRKVKKLETFAARGGSGEDPLGAPPATGPAATGT